VFRWVVVYIKSISRGKPFAEVTIPRIEARDCRILPMVNLVRDDHDVVVVNIDPTLQDITAPTGRLYANQMVENPYTRYTITEEVQSSIVPMLEKQRYQ